MTKDKSVSKRTKKFIKNKLGAELERRNKFKGKKSKKQNPNQNNNANGNNKNSVEDALLKQEIQKLIAGFEKEPSNANDSTLLEEEEDDLEDIDEDVVEFSDNDMDEDENNEEEDNDDDDIDENNEDNQESDEAEEEEIENDPNVQKLKSEVSKHKQELEELKKQDPEFAQYLKDHDKELMSFMNESESEGEGEDEEGHDDDDLEGHGGKDEDTLEPTEDGTGGRPVRSAHIDKWITEATEKDSFRSLKRLVVAFRSASHMNDEDYNSTQYHYKIVSSDAFDKLLHFCISTVADLFDGILNKEGAKASKKKKKKPTKGNTWDTSKWDNNANWPKLEPVVKSFLGSLVHIMSQITDDKTILFIIQKAEKIIPYFGAFPKLARMFLKTILDFWGSGAENVKIACFFDLRQLITSLPQFRETVLKSVYLSYVRNSKFYNGKTMKGIVLMCNCLVELYAMDMNTGYKLAFVYIRQLAIHLRNAIQLNTKDALKNVYNWQFINSLRAWCSLIAGFPDQPEVATLLYPVAQLLTAIITHNPSSKYFPLRFQCVRMLHQISGPSKVFINTAPYILETLDCAEFKKKARIVSGKPLNFATNLKVSKTVLATNLFQDAVVKNAFELLLQMFSIYATSISFPELTFPTVVFLKKFIKTNKVPAFTKKMGQLLDQIQRNAQFVQSHRDKAEFKPADIEAAKNFLADNDKAPLQQFYRNWKTTEEKLKQLKGQEEDDDDEEDQGFSDEEEEDQPPKKKSKVNEGKSKPQQNSQPNNKQPNNKQADKQPNNKQANKQANKQGKRGKQEKKKAGSNNKADIVEDFVLSDDE